MIRYSLRPWLAVSSAVIRAQRQDIPIDLMRSPREEFARRLLAHDIFVAIGGFEKVCRVGLAIAELESLLHMSLLLLYDGAPLTCLTSSGVLIEGTFSSTHFDSLPSGIACRISPAMIGLSPDGKRALHGQKAIFQCAYFTALCRQF